jgi:tetratricopeptide (TPR) repeat protein
MLDVIEELMHKGVELHKSGKVEVAAQLYSVVLKEHPEHPDANHNMGVLAVGIGKIPEALRFFETALEANADVAQFWVSYIDALIGAGRMGDAQAVLDQAKSNGARGEGFDQLEARLNVSAQGQLMTCSAASEAHPQKPNILDSLKLDQAIRLAKKKSKEDTGEEAKRIYQDILIKFPKNKRAMEGLKALVGTRVGKASKVQDPPQEQQQLLISLYNERQFIQVLEQITVLLEMFPNSSFLHNISGAVYKGLGHLDTSIEAYKKALALKPDSAVAFYNMGNVLKERGKLEEAIEAYNKALVLNPDNADAHNNLGIAFKEQGKFEMAMEAYHKALAIKSDYAAAYCNMGVVLADQSKLEEAITAYRNSLSLNPDYAEAHYNMAGAFAEQGNIEEAIASYKKALSLNSDYADAYNNIGNIFADQGKLEEAIEAYSKALAINPDYGDAHNGLSFALLNVGELKRGLDEYEWRWKSTKYISSKRHFSQPLWDGQKSLQNKKILLWCEQGVGDTINWASCLPLVTSQAKHCIVECQEKLVPLLSRSFPNVEVKPENRSLDTERNDFDYHLPMGSLYRSFASEVSRKAKADAFLFPDPVRINFWRKRLISMGKGPYVGISWKSANMSAKRLPNYASTSDLSPVLTLPGVTFINLQYVDFADDLSKIQNELGVTVHHFDDLDHYNDLLEVAALCAALDIIVSTTSAVPFISAGVGTLTKFASWKQSPWSNNLFNPVGPSVDKFERNTWQSWHNVFHLIAEDILKLSDDWSHQ